MTAVTAPKTAHQVPAAALDESDGITFGRLVHVELRKLVDTRAGRWLLIAIGVITVLVMGIMLFTAQAKDMTFENFLLGSAVPQGILLPILGILAVTTEWSQRTGLVTFTLEPRRSRVAAAKLVSAVIMALVAVAVALAIAALATVIAVTTRDGIGSWSLGASILGGAVLLQVLEVAQGVGFGMLLLNTPAAIVAYLALPTAWSILGGLISGLEPYAKWLDMGRTSEPLLAGTMNTDAWLHLSVSAGVWVVLPIALGAWRLIRREVK